LYGTWHRAGDPGRPAKTNSFLRAGWRAREPIRRFGKLLKPNKKILEILFFLEFQKILTLPPNFLTRHEVVKVVRRRRHRRAAVDTDFDR
jgi:hypothetical protein